MELKNATVILAIALSSCQWFDPRDVGEREEWQPHVYVNVSLSSDSTFCSFSTPEGWSQSTNQQPLDACVQLQSTSGEQAEGCASGMADALGFWVPTTAMESLVLGDSLALEVSSNLWEDFSAQAAVPSAPAWTGVELGVRTYQEGSKDFDELSVHLVQEEEDQKWHLIQLLFQVDTVAAGPPKFQNLRSLDTNVVIRKHGNSALDNAILLGAEAWEGDEYVLRFHSRNKLDEDVPFHYVLIVQSVSRELFEFWLDLEAIRQEEELFARSNVDGAGGCFGLTLSESQLVFP